MGTLGEPFIHVVMDGQQLGDVLEPREGAALLVRMAALAATAFFLVDVVSAPVVGWRRIFAGTIVVVIAGSLVAGSDPDGGSWEVLVLIVLSGHVLATAAWLGGLVALVAVLMGREDEEDPDWVIRRFSLVVVVSVGTLALTGVIHAVAVAGGVSSLATSTYGLVLLVKIVLVAMILLWGGHARRSAADVYVRMRSEAQTRVKSRGAHALAVVTGTELILALAILTTTSVPVGVSP